jgi:hypothetical protein
MAQNPENRFIDRVNDRLPIKKRKGSSKAREKWPENLIHYEKMCNPMRGGTADGWYSGKGGDLWIEYKWVSPMPVSKIVKASDMLSALQLDWLTERYAEGRNVAVVIGCPMGGLILHNPSAWKAPFTAEDFCENISDVSFIAEWIMRKVG